MRGARWLLLVAMAVIIGAVGFTYRIQKRGMRAGAIAKPDPLPEGLNSSATGYHFMQSRPNSCNSFDMLAQDAKQVKDSSHTDLTGVVLRLNNKECTAYDLVKSAAATYFAADHRLYAEGEVEITLNIPMQGQPKHQLISVKSSGVTFDTNTGRAETDRPSTFTFENGDGQATGGYYDPDAHELQLKKDVIVHRRPPGPDSKPMTIETGNLVYHEATSDAVLSPWGRFTRDHTVVEGENPVIHIKDRKTIGQVHATKAHGIDDYPARKLQYAADDLLMEFDDNGEIQKITGQTNARLVSTSDTSETTVTANHVELNFVVRNKESLLTRVIASGSGVVTAKPLPARGRELGETHVLRSDALEMTMRPGGRELEKVATQAPGTLEFLPNLPAQRHRILTGNNMLIAYGPANHIDTFHATGAKTQTEPNAEERKHNRPPSFTSSRDIMARFDPKSGQLASMEQSGDFTYKAGDRDVSAAKATLDSDQKVILLETGARMSDSTGATSADRIHLDQTTGDFVADGNVNSTRMPDTNPQKNNQMLSGDEPLQARAKRMESTNHNHTIHYTGNAMMWQGASKIQADTIDVERDKHSLIANGNVVSTLWEQPKPDAQKKSASPVMTVVHAQRLVYTDDNRLADYTGGVTLNRPNLREKSRELHAYLADSGADSRLEKAFADGAVEIVQTSPGHTRTGTAEHSEYYMKDQKVLLRGGSPKLVDSGGDNTQGPELTYWFNDARLTVVGDPKQPAQSEIIRHRKK